MIPHSRFSILALATGVWSELSVHLYVVKGQSTIWVLIVEKCYENANLAALANKTLILSYRGYRSYHSWYH